MESKPVPELQAKIESAAQALGGSAEDSLDIVGADNKILVKAGTKLGQDMLFEQRVLFPIEVAGKEYLVCIKEVR